ncbi:hypothetical protein GCM10010112_24410 [Actinoplanes lobatus]|uniref:Uncharacterized protein n=1 Tax=Actinoplanes lobatus TaxID=113568 RepID=A0A7W7HJ39_9ACTN|nr:hypothetical protein [Actinoplanes lobatus]MBB4751483.1 hypothetical protein [Actinoplanes lobatus]GGN64319.1 hypothetical protein GCM10010112_24410 [Actinoplanes lobatus]GIE41092.1 hypothetical protein Alo02nite_39900 [Actinoplanes lobatus]
MTSERLAAGGYRTGAADELVDLLPRWYRLADEEGGEPLRALLAAIEEQIDRVRDATTRQYEDWFVETAAARALPLIGDLVGYRPLAGYQRILSEGLHDGGPSGDSIRRLAEALAPRRDVAGTVGYRRRKGTLSLLEELADAAAGWPARAVETSRLLAHTQPVRLYGGTTRTDTVRATRGSLADLRDGGALDLIGTPFESSARTFDVRRAGVEVHVWRQKAYPVTDAPAYRVEGARNRFTFSVLGADTHLVTRPEPEPSTTHAATVDNVPARLRRRLFADRLADYYGPGKSVVIRRGDRLVPVSGIVVADLTGWHYQPARDRVAVDPELGRIAFSPRADLDDGVHVSYHYAFSDDLGGGEYPRDLVDPDGTTVYRVGPGQPYRRIADAHREWRADRPADAVIEITDSGAYQEELAFRLGGGQRLTLRAADGARPVLRLLDWSSNQPDALDIEAEDGCADASVTLDGLLVAGRGIRAGGPLATLTLRHCTLVPNGDEPSLFLERATATVHIERCVLGPIRVLADEVGTDPAAILLRDSILDAACHDGAALAAPDGRHAHAELHADRTTVIGETHVHAVGTVSDSIFTGILHVARRQRGILRFCFVPPGSRTPRRVRCQSGRRPVFAGLGYGAPDYGRLAADCPAEIARGAGDGSEMGVFHDLYQPQREDNLRARLAEYTPAGTRAAIGFVS